MTERRVRCTGAHDRCGGLMDCPYCEEVEVDDPDPDRLREDAEERRRLWREAGE